MKDLPESGSREGVIVAPPQSFTESLWLHELQVNTARRCDHPAVVLAEDENVAVTPPRGRPVSVGSYQDYGGPLQNAGLVQLGQAETDCPSPVNRRGLEYLATSSLRLIRRQPAPPPR